MFPEIVAKLAIADEDPSGALAALSPILSGSVPVHDVSVVIRALVLDAVIRDRLGEVGEAEAAIEQALDLAQPDRLVMPVAHSQSRKLLAHHPRHRTAHRAFLSEILGALSGVRLGPFLGGAGSLREPLSGAELRVLRFLPSNLTTAEIAGEIFVSINTVKTRMRHIYTKLDAHTRAEALARARAAGLLAPTGRRQ